MAKYVQCSIGFNFLVIWNIRNNTIFEHKEECNFRTQERMQFCKILINKISLSFLNIKHFSNKKRF